jgi:hypothetical protein
MARKPKICDQCGEQLPPAGEWPALKTLGGNRCESCDKLLCPQCLRVDVAGTVYCEDCAEAVEVDVSQACVVCGCSQHAACEGGCSWAHDVDAGESPRCSRCPKP